MALTSDGQIFVWGRGEYGRLGVGDRTGSSKLRPQPVRGLEAHTIVQVRASWLAFCYSCLHCFRAGLVTY